MYANFYNKNNKCLFSIRVNTEKQAEKIADIYYAGRFDIEDWTLTEKPISKKILE